MNNILSASVHVHVNKHQTPSMDTMDFIFWQINIEEEISTKDNMLRKLVKPIKSPQTLVSLENISICTHPAVFNETVYTFF